MEWATNVERFAYSLSWFVSSVVGFVFMCNIETMTWSQPITTGTTPSVRAGHSCVAVGTKLYLFGGGDGTTYLNDLHILDTGTIGVFKNFSVGSNERTKKLWNGLRLLLLVLALLLVLGIHVL